MRALLIGLVLLDPAPTPPPPVRLECPTAQVSPLEVQANPAIDATSREALWFPVEHFAIALDLAAGTGWFSGVLIGTSERTDGLVTGSLREIGESYEIRREERRVVHGVEVRGETLYVHRRTGELGHFVSLPGGRSVATIRRGDCRLEAPRRF